MTLQDYLETAPKDRVIYVGAKSGFLAVGFIGKDLAYDPKNKEFAENDRKKGLVKYPDLMKQLDQYDEDLRKRWRAKKKEIDDKKITVEKPLSILRRKVVDIWERQEEDALNVKVETAKYDIVGKIYTIHEKRSLLHQLWRGRTCRCYLAAGSNEI